MQDNYADNLNTFLNEQQEESLRYLKKTNSQYAKLYTLHSENSGRMEAIQNSLSPEDKKFTEQYIDDIYSITGKELNHIYLQGYKDCIRLLCILDVMEVKV